MPTDQANVEVRVATPEGQSEKVVAHEIQMSVRTKLVITLLLMIAILGGATFAAPHLLSPLDVYLVALTALVALGFLYLVADTILIRPLLLILDWFRVVRESGFTNVPVIPVTSKDEVGHLANDMGVAISNLWSDQKRIDVLLAHKSDTITLVEHQLRMPLTALRWSLEGVTVPQDVLTALLRLEITVQAIIEASRIEEGKFGYVFTKVDLVQVIEATVARFKPLADSRSIELTFVHGADLPSIRGDEDRLALVMTNLLSNAIDYTANGGHVSVSASLATDGSVLIVVEDTGIGISPTEMLLIFNKFHRGADAVQMRPDGSGLGLFVTKNILHAHNSEIVVESVQHQGTRVSFKLPVMEM
jgi:signal transduction histidine kinase